MLTDKDLRELLEFSAPEPVLSVYLNTDPVEGNADAYRLRLRNMLKEVNLPDDIRQVEQYLNREFDWSGRSVAMISCAPRGFFRAYRLAVPVRSRVRVGERPSVKALADLLDAYGGYGVALVDKQGARLFSFHLGELREQEGVMGEEVRHTKHGGASSLPGRRGGAAGQKRTADEVVDRNMKDAVDFTVGFFEENRVRRVLIGGTDDNVAHFRSMLPKAWQSLVVGTFPMSMTASHSEVLARAMQIGQEAERHRENRLIEAMITAAAKGSGGVVNLDETLNAIHDGRVQTLLIMDGYRAAGYRCTGCGFLTTQNSQACPYCGKTFEQIEDAVEMAVRAAMQTGSDVEVIHSSPALDKAGKIGALLRY
jgi:peptide subunit release factor 1 (eRF1)